jgi:hypothetical protein
MAPSQGILQFDPNQNIGGRENNLSAIERIFKTVSVVQGNGKGRLKEQSQIGSHIVAKKRKTDKANQCVHRGKPSSIALIRLALQ